ncbi:hypothetical protein MnTg02_01466 [bacterium MnTg02]|nr:hypothetical protein MnTg02_01466 [bacterium MnTg02]
MFRPILGMPGWAKILKFEFDTFDVKSHSTAASKDQCDMPLGRLAFVKLHGQQVKHAIGTRERDILDLCIEDPINMQSRTAADIIFAAGLFIVTGILPIKSVGDGGEPLLGWQIRHIANTQHRILEMRRYDLKIFPI